MNALQRWSWKVQMAMRDARRHKLRLLVYFISITTGIAALTAIETFRYNIKGDFDTQAIELIGADFTVSINQIPTKAQLELISAIPGIPAEEISFASMIYLPKTGKSRLVQVRALKGKYPYYGQIETQPENVMEQIKATPKSDSAFIYKGQCVIDKTVMLQFGLGVGDTVKVGNGLYKISAALIKAPGQTGITATVAPVVYVGYNSVEHSGLLQKGSRVFYRYFYKFDKPAEAEKLAQQIKKDFQKENINFETAETRKKNLDNSFRDFINYLNLIGFIALILGGLGVSATVKVHLDSKKNTVSLLRCLGVSAKEAFHIFVIQISILSTGGAALGVLGGTLMQIYFPVLLKDFLPVEVSTNISIEAIFSGLFTGVFMAVFFALPELLKNRKIPPLAALRSEWSEANKQSQKTTGWLFNGLLICMIAGFSFWKTQDINQTTFFTGFISIAYLVLRFSAGKIVFWIKRSLPPFTPVFIKIGVGNLQRPGNQSALLITTLGIGIALIAMLTFTKELLLKEIQLADKTQQPNLILFDIRKEQLDSIKQQFVNQNLPLIQEVPIVLMELKAIKGTPTYIIRQDSNSKIPKWALNREYRITYRDELLPSEKIIKGKWIGRANSINETIPISLEEDYARMIKISIGDTMLFNIQGVEARCIVASTRRITWNRVQSNFLVVFPSGVLEPAPKVWSVVSRTSNAAQSAELQAILNERYPNVSTIDLALILDTVEKLIEKISTAINFLGLFCLVTGLVVMVASLFTSKYQRMKEIALLRTLGAKGKSIRSMLAMEFIVIGCISGTIGVVLAAVGTYTLGFYLFNNVFIPTVFSVFKMVGLVMILTLFTGLLITFGITRTSPLAAIRDAEG
jgi:putative ABC transport system permease protein